MGHLNPELTGFIENSNLLTFAVWGGIPACRQETEVVWGGIEPPTQGFSVLCSTN